MAELAFIASTMAEQPSEQAAEQPAEGPEVVLLPLGGDINEIQGKSILDLTHVKISIRPPRSSRAAELPEGGRELTMYVSTPCVGQNCPVARASAKTGRMH